MITLLNESKDTSKSLYLGGKSLSDKSFKHLRTCQNLEELGISFAEEIGELGIDSISKLHNEGENP